jgi:tetratricopeptide (TPR) repeat protein
LKRPYWASLLIFLMGIFILSCVHGGRDISLLDDYYNLAREFHEQKIYDRAELYYLECLSLDNDQTDCLFNLALLYLETKRPDKALVYLRKLLERDIQNTLVLNGMGIGYSQKEEWDTALTWYGKTLEQYPWDRVALYNSALVYEKMDKPDKAQETLETLWERDRSYKTFTALYPYYDKAAIDEKIRLVNGTETEKEEETLHLIELLLELYLQGDFFEEALPLLTNLYESHGSRGAWYLFKKGDLLIHLYRIEEGLNSIRQAFREGFHDQAEIDDLADRLAPSTREVLTQLEELYFPQNNALFNVGEKETED